MSQAKVDQYKKEKANRKQTIARNKVLKHIRHAAEIIVLVAIIALVGYKVYDNKQKNAPAETYYVNLNSLSEYVSSLDQ